MRGRYHSGLRIPSLAVFPIFVEQFDVTDVTLRSDVAPLYGSGDCTAGFVRMRAVVVLAVGGVTHEFRKVTEHFARFDVHEPESLDAGGVDDVSAACQRVHAGERGRVHPLVVVLRNPVDADICIGYERLDEGGFARPRVACQQGGLSGREFAQRLQTGAFGRRHGIDRIAGGLIYRDELVQFVGRSAARSSLLRTMAAGMA